MKGDGNVKATRKVACRTGSKVQVAPCYEVLSKVQAAGMLTKVPVVRVFSGVKLTK